MADMEVSSKAEYESLNQRQERKGGFRACMYIFVLVAFDNMGFIANMVSLVLYFLEVMYFDVANSSNTLTNFMGSTFLFTVIGGFISDTFLNRFTTIMIFAVIEILGLVLMTIQAHAKSLHPPYCGGKPTCVEGNIAFMLYASLSLLALGSGGVRGALPSLGADQFNQNDPEDAKALATYFNWMTLSTVLGAAVGVTGIVWVGVNIAWYKGFMISTIASFVGFVVLACGKRYYRLRKPGESPLTRIVQVIVVAIKNRKSSLPENPDELYEISDKERIFSDEKLAHTNQFRFLDRAAIRRDQTATPWTVCSVTHVEEVKILTRMLPILFSTIIMNTCLAQLQTFSVQQGYLMNKFIGKFEVPPPSIPVIPLLFMAILIPMYELFFVPFARKITGHPSGITQLQRVGIGLVLSAISMTVAGIVEVKRRDQAHKDLAHPISLFWLSFQYGIFGIADMFTLVGLLEFFYKEAPSGMKSLSTSFTWLSLSFGYFLSTVFVNIINSITKRITPSKQGWLHGNNINDNNLNLFYWFLAILSCINFGIYLLMASWYKYKTDDVGTKDEANVSRDRLLLARAENATESTLTITEKVEESTVEKREITKSESEADVPSFEQTNYDKEKNQ